MVKKLFYIVMGLSIGGAVLYFIDPFKWNAKMHLLATFKAYQANDLPEFQKYADLDSLCFSPIDELFLLERNLLGENLYEFANMLHGGANDKPMIKRLVAKGLKEIMKASVKHNKINEKHPKVFGITDIFNIQVIESDGDMVLLEYPFKYQGEAMPVRFRMRKMQGEWRLVGVAQFSKAIKVFNPLKNHNKEERKQRREERKNERKQRKEHHNDIEVEMDTNLE